jgi:hypothetical protein
LFHDFSNAVSVFIEWPLGSLIIIGVEGAFHEFLVVWGPEVVFLGLDWDEEEYLEVFQHVAPNEFFGVFYFFFAPAMPGIVFSYDFEGWGDGYFLLAYPTVHCLADLVHFVFLRELAFCARSLVTLDRESGPPSQTAD